jgi:hypothetical protein
MDRLSGGFDVRIEVRLLMWAAARAQEPCHSSPCAHAEAAQQGGVQRRTAICQCFADFEGVKVDFHPLVVNYECRDSGFEPLYFLCVCDVFPRRFLGWICS